MTLRLRVGRLLALLLIVIAQLGATPILASTPPAPTGTATASATPTDAPPLTATATPIIDSTGTASPTATTALDVGTTYVVTTTQDDYGPGTLRSAIANAHSGDTITFAPGLGPIVLRYSGYNTYDLTYFGSELRIPTNLTIVGPAGSAQTIDGNGTGSVFGIDPGVQAVLANLAIVDGRASGGGGGCDTGCPAGDGGGVRNGGMLTIDHSTISGNSAGGGGSYDGLGDLGGSGGGIANYGTLTINNSTIVRNSGGPGGGPFGPTSYVYVEGGPGGDGGGIANYGSLTISQTTIVSNSAGAGGNAFGDSNGDGMGGRGGDGGGIYNMGVVSISDSTVADNTSGAGGQVYASTTLGGSPPSPGPRGSDGAGGGIVNTGNGDTVTISDTIVAGNTAATSPDCAGNVTSGDYNLIQTISGCTMGGSAGHDIIGADPLLGPLQDNGGPTYTMAPQPGSPAVDDIPAASCGASTDQRGYPRPDDNEAFCNIGAVEGEISLSAATPTPTQDGTSTATATDTPSPTPTGTPSPTPTLLSGEVAWHPHYRVRLSDHLSASVDLADGHVDVAAAGMRIPGVGLDLALDHTWDSNLAARGITGTTGQGWQSSLSPSVGGVLTGTMVFTDTTGATWPFTATNAASATSASTTAATAAYTTPPGLPWQLIASSAPMSGTASYTLTNILSDETLTFDGQGRFLADTDTYGNQNALLYIGNGPPSSLGNSGGRSLNLSYTSSGLLSEAQSPQWQSSSSGGAPVGQHVTYGYNGGGQLTSITWGAGTNDAQTAQFGYTGSQLTTITTPGAHAWTLAYDESNHLTDITSPASATVDAVDAAPAWDTNLSYFQGIDGAASARVVQGYGSDAPVTTTYALDAQGQTTTIFDGLGATTQFTYDTDHDVTARTDANNHTTNYGYIYAGASGSVGLPARVEQPAVDANGPAVTTNSYDARYDLVKTTSPNNGATYYTYDGHHAVATMATLLVANGCAPPVGPPAPSSSNAPCQPWRGQVNRYDAAGQLVAVTDGRGVDASADLTPTVTLDPALGAAYTRNDTYTPTGDLHSASSAPISTTTGSATTTGPATTTYAYDGDGNLTMATSPGGHQTRYAVDHLGRLVGTTQVGVALSTGAPAQDISTGIGYDGDGNVVTTTDGTGAMTRFSYDALGRLASETSPLGATTRYGYTATHLRAAQNPLGQGASDHVTRYNDDLADRPITTTDPLGVATGYGYDAAGNLTTVTTPLDWPGGGNALSVETRGYDARDQLTSDTVAGVGEPTPSAAQTTAYSYDQNGNVTQRQAPNGDATYHFYDPADRLIGRTLYPTAQTAPVGAQPSSDGETFGYDVEGNVIDHGDFYLRDHASTYDAANRGTRRVDSYLGAQAASPITTTASYDADSNTASLRREAGGRMTGLFAATYNAAGWPLSASDGLVTTNYGYDAAGRPVGENLRAGSASAQVATGYDADGRVTGITDTISGLVAPPPVVSVTPTPSPTPPSHWDCASIATPTPLPTPGATPTAPAAYTSSSASCFVYDAAGEPVRDTVPGGVRTTRDYDADGRLRSLDVGSMVPLSDPSYWDRAFSYTRSPQGWTTRIVAGAGYANGGGATTHDLGYEAHRYTRSDADSITLGTFQWQYDGNGNLPQETHGSGSIQVTNYSDTNADGTRPTNWLPNETLRVTNKANLGGTTAYGYDGSGNTTAITDTPPGLNPTPRTTRLSYDAAGRLSAAGLPDGGRVAIGYNARGLRASLAVYAAHNGQPTYTETFLYSGSRVRAVAVTGAHPFVEAFVYRPDGTPLELIYQEPLKAPRRYWYVVDGQGSVVALTDQTGTVVNRYWYDLWGQEYNRGVYPQFATQEAVLQPLRYRGYWDDAWYGGAATTTGALQGALVQGAPLARVQSALRLALHGAAHLSASVRAATRLTSRAALRVTAQAATRLNARAGTRLPAKVVVRVPAWMSRATRGQVASRGHAATRTQQQRQGRAHASRVRLQATEAMCRTKGHCRGTGSRCATTTRRCAASCSLTPPRSTACAAMPTLSTIQWMRPIPLACTL